MRADFCGGAISAGSCPFFICPPVRHAIPRLSPPGEAAILGPTYNEHAASFTAAGWSVAEVSGLEELAGADLAVVVNPNNPDGRRFTPEDLVALRTQVGRLVVDESFVDPEPTLSLAPRLPVDGLLVLRSFGKFYGLAGLRLGFVLGSAEDIAALSALAGPWPVSGAAIEIGTAALRDGGWREESRVRLRDDCQRLDHLAEGAGWRLVGGAALFRTYETPDAGEAQAQLAHGRVWSRIFPYSKTWLRLGLPGDDVEFKQLARALAG